MVGVTLVVGLGNPGPEYQFTPHNAGFLAIDRIAERCGVGVNNRRQQALTGAATVAGRQVLLAKPQTYMNLSGVSIRGLLGDLEVGSSELASRLIVLYDDIDFSLGTVRIKERGSAAGHNGVKSITSELGTPEWTRIRIGIAPEEEKAADRARRNRKDFVLQPLRKMQMAVLDEGIEKAADAVEAILRDGISAAMNKFNQRLAE
jgi:PTH1 family peptidyl-tRNA hydrolase